VAEKTPVVLQVVVPGGCVFDRAEVQNAGGREFRVSRKDLQPTVNLGPGVEFGTLVAATGIPSGPNERGSHILLELADLIPLVEGQLLREGIWLFRWSDAIVQNGVAKIPFRRRPGGAQSVRAGTLLELQSTRDAFCRPSLQVVDSVRDPIGCLESLHRTADMPTDWMGLLLDDSGGIVKNGVTGSPLGFPSIKLQLFMAYNVPKKLQILPSKHFIPKDTAFIGLTDKFTEPFRKRGLSLTFEAESATGVAIYWQDTVASFRPVVPGGSAFTVQLPPVTDVYVAATTTDSSLALRVFPVSVTFLTLFTFSDSRGLIQVRGTGSTFEPGFSRQIIRSGTDVRVYKAWTGPVVRSVLATPLEITISNAISGEFQTFSVESRQFDTPYLVWLRCKSFNSRLNFRNRSRSNCCIYCLRSEKN
jgi:hypothetical protein